MSNTVDSRPDFVESTTKYSCMTLHEYLFSCSLFPYLWTGMEAKELYYQRSSEALYRFVTALANLKTSCKPDYFKECSLISFPPNEFCNHLVFTF
jgi:hypothetical protein